MIPHEKTLVKRLENEPFTLLGINSDSEERYRRERPEMGVTWPSFFDGGNTGGPIAMQWGVSGWPTIYVLDHTGRIRFKGVRNEAMDAAVDQLLAEMKGELPVPSTEELLEQSFGRKTESIPAVRKLPARRVGAADGEATKKASVAAVPLIPAPKKKD